MRDPLKMNSRGSALVFSVVVAIMFSPNDCGWVIITMMKSSNAAVVLIHELQRVSVRPRSALREFRKTSELVSGLTVIREELVGTADSFEYADFPLVTPA
jgi:hypothetical protein